MIQLLHSLVSYRVNDFQLEINEKIMADVE